MSNRYFDIDDEGKRLFITQTAMRAKLPAIVVEKDLWVTLVLQLVFKLPFADRIIFKGGSSLSKCWDLIGRMSEDVDLAYDSNFGIFEGDEPTVKQIKKLRKQSSIHNHKPLLTHSNAYLFKKSCTFAPTLMISVDDDILYY